MKMGSWADDIKTVQKSAEHVTDALAELDGWLTGTGGSREGQPAPLPERVQAFLELLRAEMSRIGQAGVGLFKRLSTEPVAKLLGGSPLTREEFHLLQAMGIPLAAARSLGLAPLDDFEVLGLLRYEEGARRAYINPGLSNAKTAARGELRYGIAPEDVRLADLRPEQRAFFETHCPGLLARFRRE